MIQLWFKQNRFRHKMANFPDQKKGCFGSHQFCEYTEDDDKCIGKVCLRCWEEWLPAAIDVGSTTVRRQKLQLFSQQMSFTKFQRAFQVTISRREVIKKYLHLLKPGDHIMWKRPYVLWHHAIVVEPASKPSEILKVIHWSNSNGSPEIHEANVDFSKEPGKMYKVFYNKSIKAKNPPNLVLARARALKGLKNYDFFSKNCENFARFCKTGVSFNQQYPWLMLKLDETATGAFVRSITAMLLADVLEFSWNHVHQLVGAVIVMFMELILILSDLGDMYFQYKYSTSDDYMSKEDYRESIIMRVCEFLFGSAGIISGSILFVYLSVLAGRTICPGLGTTIGFCIGIMTFAVFGGFILGILAKAIGNVVGMYISRMYEHCTGSRPRKDTELFTYSIKRNGNMVFAKSGIAKHRKMRKSYRPSSWEGQAGILMIIFNSILLYAFATQYMNTYKHLSGSIQARCITRNTTFLSQKHHCVAIHVEIMDNQDDTDFDTGFGSYTEQSTSQLVATEPNNSGQNTSQLSEIGPSVNSEQDANQLFENEHTFYTSNCSYVPSCSKGDARTQRAVAKYVSQFGTPGAIFTCYHTNNRSQVIRQLTPTSTFVHMFFWPSLCLCVGIALIVHAFFRHKEKGEFCLMTLLAISGMRSYFTLLERCQKTDHSENMDH